VTARVTDTDRGARALAESLRALGKARVRVGVLADAPKKTGTRTGKRGRQIQQAATLAEVAAAHEFGTATIPQRSFIRATVDLKAAVIAAEQEKLAAQVVDSKITPEVAMERLGAAVQGMVQVRIAEGIGPALAPATVARKGSDKQLVDTGQLRSSVTYQVLQGGTGGGS
jgi:phage gpG-like protein